MNVRFDKLASVFNFFHGGDQEETICVVIACKADIRRIHARAIPWDREMCQL